MMRLILILLGVDYLRSHWRGLRRFGWVTLIAGTVIFIDALDGVLYFPIEPFACLLLVEGGATLLVAHSGMGGQRILRYVKGATFSLAAVLILAGNHDGDIVLAMIFGTLFLLDGALQIASAIVVRYRRWRPALVGGIVEIALAIFFYQPWPSDYSGTVPYCLGLGLAFAGWNMFILANRVKVAAANPGLKGEEYMEEADTHQPAVVEWDGPPDDDEKALTVHVWTPVGSAPGETISRPVISRYIAAVDKNGVISTGHAALESPGGVYISLYPAVEIDRSPDAFARLLRATPENNVPGEFQPDYITESRKWCHSTRKVRIRNYSETRLAAFWENYRQNESYNLTHRNCSSSVARALEAALEGSVGRLWQKRGFWLSIGKLMSTPELWVALQLRKRAETMAWTPGLVLDYARAMSMLADPRPTGWFNTLGRALRKMFHRRLAWVKGKHGEGVTGEEDAG
ncbi:HdeD family acid-resistance protein [Lelliottia amnigena]